MNAKEILEGFKESSQYQDRNSRLTECENSIMFLEAKFKKIEGLLRDIPSHYVMPGINKKKFNEITCGKCKDHEVKIVSLIKKQKAQEAHYEARFLNSVNIKKAHYENLEASENEHKFLLKRIVGVYGNKALVDLMNHVENPSLSDVRLEQYMKIKPHF